MPQLDPIANPRIAVVVPAHQAESMIAACLDGLFAGGFPPEEILVVDDGSRDRTGAIAADMGVRVIRNEAPLQPAEARNRGARMVEADVIVFVDADVIVHPNVRGRIVRHFRDGTIDALFGSYDDDPAAPALVSRYRNLLHHFVHQNSREEASTFWTGFGAVRRDLFLRLGGLNKEWQNIEDVEFGFRVKRSGGRIRLDPNLLSKHLKAWTAGSMFRTDLWGRAVPWTRLLLRYDDMADNDLNLGLAHKVSALAIIVFAAGLVLSPLTPWLLLASLGAAVAFAAANWPFLSFLKRRHGFGFALGAVPFHVLHYVAALVGYAYANLDERNPLRERGSTIGSERSKPAR